MRYSGEIKKLNHIVISDPSYDEDVTCRYERKKLNQKDWKIDLDINSVTTKVVDDFSVNGIEFFLLLYKDSSICQLKENGEVSYNNTIEIDETNLGMDTACIAFGINENAEKIIELRKEWQPECSLKTFTDGIFGDVAEGKLGGNTVFMRITGYLDEDTGYSIEDILYYFQQQLKIENLVRDEEHEKENDIEIDV